MEIPQRHLAQIFGMNIGQKVEIIAIGDFKFTPTLIAHNHGNSFDELIGIDHAIADKCKILKRPLSSITADEYVELIMMQLNKYGHPFDEIIIDRITHCSVQCHSKFKGKFYSNYYFVHNDFTYNQLQYLHALEYALPITLLDDNNKPVTYSVETLVENGVYKLTN